jgi:hypothetical protein
LVIADWEARVIWIPGALRYNPPANPKVVLGWGRFWPKFPDCDLKQTAYSALKDLAGGRDKSMKLKSGMSFSAAFLLACGDGSGNGIGNRIKNGCQNGIGYQVAGSSDHEDKKTSSSSAEQDSAADRTPGSHQANLFDEPIREELDDSPQEPDEPEPADASPVVIRMPLRGGKDTMDITEEKVREYRELFTAIDVVLQLKRVRQWLLDNPHRLSGTPRGTRSRITGWLGREQDKAVKAGPQRAPGASAGPRPWEEIIT